MTRKELIQAVGECTDLRSAKSYLDRLNLEELAPQHFSFLGRKIDGFIDSPDTRIAYLSNFTIDLLSTYLHVHAAFRDFRSDSYVGAFNQYFQEVLTAGGTLTKFRPDIIFLSLAMRHLEPVLFYSYSELTEQERRDQQGKLLNHFDQWIAAAAKRFDADLVITNFPLPPFTHLGIADMNDSFSEMNFYNELNMGLAELSRRYSRVHILDLAKLSARLGYENTYDSKLYYIAKMLWSEKLVSLVAEEVVRYITALKGWTKKCLICDLDNTLWGGIVGEDGPLGVKVGHGDPVSEAFWDFQYKIKSLKSRGIMLAICSKNNRGDVEETFKQRPEMPLKLSDFAATKINWDHKHINITRLALELNIGLDSLVFIDDNPVECELVKQLLPQVKTIHLPSDHERMADMVDKLIEFEKIVVLEDDRGKTVQYHQKKQREELRESVGDLKDYLASLQTEVCIRPAQEPDLERVHQLFMKTNQFNVTTIRYSMGDVEKFHKSNQYDISVVFAKDRFGDLGIIGLYLLVFKNDSIYIDSFILSCRAMGRGIESAMMNKIKKRCISTENTIDLKAKYIPTKKNIPVKIFFVEQGFAISKAEKDGTTYYSLGKEHCIQFDCSWINIME